MAEDVCNVLEKNCMITVRVDEAVRDIIVVSFSFQGKLFQGVLLDSSKKLLPCGIIPPANELPPMGSAPIPAEDKLFSVSQRYSYFQAKPSESRQPPKTTRIKTARMTVRLRPRQVLCSKCRGICNENSENVDFSAKKRKLNDGQTELKLPKPAVDRRLRSSRPSLTESDTISQTIVPEPKPKKVSAPLAPKGNANDENNINGRVQKLRIVGKWRKSVEEESDFMADNGEKCDVDPLLLNSEQTCGELIDGSEEADDGDNEYDPLSLGPKVNTRRLLRKKRSVGSMEDLWDETVFEDSAKNLEKKTKTPIIKISFGSNTGEGTVVKIPPRVQTIPNAESNADAEKRKGTRDASAKAAKKALKKAKKEARKKLVGGGSPGACSLGGGSPRYPSLSPRYFVPCASPHRPAQIGIATIGAVSPAYEVFHKKHKHKVKHKKRHKEDKKARSEDIENRIQQEENKSSRELFEPPEGAETEAAEDTIRECLKQKLSISLKRLSATAYTRLSCSSSPSHSDASDESQSDAVPDFPNPNQSMMMRLSAASDTHQPISSCQTSDGRLMAVGDVVWGKIHGFPWWPGKVTAITMVRKDDGVICPPQAHVSWYGSSTSSLISCDQLNPFLETFQIRYNKKKRGPYKEAIKQATTEAKRGDIPIPPELYLSPEVVDVVS